MHSVQERLGVHFRLSPEYPKVSFFLSFDLAIEVYLPLPLNGLWLLEISQTVSSQEYFSQQQRQNGHFRKNLPSLLTTLMLAGKLLGQDLGCGVGNRLVPCLVNSSRLHRDGNELPGQ